LKIRYITISVFKGLKVSERREISNQGRTNNHLGSTSTRHQQVSQEIIRSNGLIALSIFYGYKFRIFIQLRLCEFKIEFRIILMTCKGKN